MEILNLTFCVNKQFNPIRINYKIETVIHNIYNVYQILHIEKIALFLGPPPPIFRGVNRPKTLLILKIEMLITSYLKGICNF